MSSVRAGLSPRLRDVAARASYVLSPGSRRAAAQPTNALSLRWLSVAAMSKGRELAKWRRLAA